LHPVDVLVLETQTYFRAGWNDDVHDIGTIFAVVIIPLFRHGRVTAISSRPLISSTFHNPAEDSNVWFLLEAIPPLELVPSKVCRQFLSNPEGIERVDFEIGGTRVT
jgi:hypothetical protein